MHVKIHATNDSRMTGFEGKLPGNGKFGGDDDWPTERVEPPW